MSILIEILSIVPSIAAGWIGNGIYKNRKNNNNLIKLYSTEDMPVIKYDNLFDEKGILCPYCNGGMTYIRDRKAVCHCDDYPFVHFHLEHNYTDKTIGCCLGKFVMMAKTAQ